MTILSLPVSPPFQKAKFSLRSNTQLFTSPLNRSSQTLELPGAVWGGDFTLPPIQDPAIAAAWAVFFVQLRGQSGRFYAGDPKGATPRGTPTGTPLVAGASQTGTSLTTDGWTPSKTVFKAGDYFSVTGGSRREMKKIVADATSDGSGNATLTFEPPIRNSPADNAAITVSSATCIMMLADDTVSWDEAEASIWGFSFSAVEALFG